MAKHLASLACSRDSRCVEIVSTTTTGITLIVFLMVKLNELRKFNYFVIPYKTDVNPMIRLKSGESFLIQRSSTVALLESTQICFDSSD